MPSLEIGTRTLDQIADSETLVAFVSIGTQVAYKKQVANGRPLGLTTFTWAGPLFIPLATSLEPCGRAGYSCRRAGYSRNILRIGDDLLPPH
jgi:hypothetical protein